MRLTSCLLLLTHLSIAILLGVGYKALFVAVTFVVCLAGVAGCGVRIADVVAVGAAMHLLHPDRGVLGRMEAR